MMPWFTYSTQAFHARWCKTSDRIQVAFLHASLNNIAFANGLEGISFTWQGSTAQESSKKVLGQRAQRARLQRQLGRLRIQGTCLGMFPKLHSAKATTSQQTHSLQLAPADAGPVWSQGTWEYNTRGSVPVSPAMPYHSPYKRPQEGTIQFQHSTLPPTFRLPDVEKSMLPPTLQISKPNTSQKEYQGAGRCWVCCVVWTLTALTDCINDVLMKRCLECLSRQTTDHGDFEAAEHTLEPLPRRGVG